MNERILIVEDDTAISNFLEISLKHMDYKSVVAKSLKEAFQLYTSQAPDLVLLDLGLPDGDGIEFIKEVRKLSNTPIIVISARGQEHMKIDALDSGADDYLTKPFSTGELMARIRVKLRNTNQTDALNNPIIKIKELEIDSDKHQVLLKNEVIKLTPIEFKLLAYLSKHAGKVLLHQNIIKNVWGSNYDQDTQSLRVFMASLRRKIEKDPTNPEYIVTEIGVGYKMLDE